MSLQDACDEALVPAVFVERAIHLQDATLAAILVGASGPAPTPDHLSGAVATNHFHNCRLWREEDLARRSGVSDAEIVANKRAIDRHNQARNDAVERIDEHLLAQLPPLCGQARLHSETPGAMLDRLSILALKRHHMALQVRRRDANAAHRQQCEERLQRLDLQHRDLRDCLQALLEACLRGDAAFRLYRQFKMYNDPRYRGQAA